MKYDKMVAVTQEKSKRKIQLAQNTISEMLEQKEWITVAELVKRTGLSRGFFYKNPIIRMQLDKAVCRQKEDHEDKNSKDMMRTLQNPKHDIQNEIIKIRNENQELAAHNKELEKNNEQLQLEIQKLQKRLARKEVSFLKRL